MVQTAGHRPGQKDRGLLFVDAGSQIHLLSRSPYIVHPWLDVVSIRFRTLWPPHIGVRVVVHMVHSSRSIGVRVRINVSVTLRRRWHVVRR